MIILSKREKKLTKKQVKQALSNERAMRIVKKSVPRNIKAGLLLQSDLAVMSEAVDYLDCLMDDLNLFSDYASVRKAHNEQFNQLSAEKQEIKEKLEKAFSAKDWGDASPHNFINHVFSHGQDAKSAAEDTGLKIDPR